MFGKHPMFGPIERPLYTWTICARWIPREAQQVQQVQHDGRFFADLCEGSDIRLQIKFWALEEGSCHILTDWPIDQCFQWMWMKSTGWYLYHSHPRRWTSHEITILSVEARRMPNQIEEQLQVGETSLLARWLVAETLAVPCLEWKWHEMLKCWPRWMVYL